LKYALAAVRGRHLSGRRGFPLAGAGGALASADRGLRSASQEPADAVIIFAASTTAGFCAQTVATSAYGDAMRMATEATVA
jgi:hypothetical protein